MTFCVSGASGSGKTTLARALAGATGLTYRDMSFGRLAARLGHEAVRPQSLGERLDMQEAVLDAYRAEVEGWPDGVVTDRCPLDMIGYTLGEVTMHSDLGPLDERVHAYAERCLSVTDALFDAVCVVRPLPTYAAIPGRPPPSAAYQWMVHYVIEGAAGRLDRTRVSVVATSALDERVAAATAAFAAAKGDVLWTDPESRRNATRLGA